jgi:EAL and modified HD-GYP domain-containing signal transduction protein
MTSAFLARQPILDLDQSVAGYELVYPHRDPVLSLVDDSLSTARVAVNALSEIGLDHLVGQSRAWISVSPEFLSLDLARNLPPDRVVLQLGAEPSGDQSTLEFVEELRSAGYRLALDQFRYQPGLGTVLEMVDYVKVDMAALGARELAHQSFELRGFDVKVLAQKVETYEDFRLARAAGADLFQGFFFCRPHLVGARAILPSRIALMQLASALQDPSIQLSDLERLISADVGLSYRLLKYINSAYFGLRGRISSIKQAVALLGISNLRP